MKKSLCIMLQWHAPNNCNMKNIICEHAHLCWNNLPQLMITIVKSIKCHKFLLQNSLLHALRFTRESFLAYITELNLNGSGINFILRSFSFSENCKSMKSPQLVINFMIYIYYRRDGIGGRKWSFLAEIDYIHII